MGRLAPASSTCGVPASASRGAEDVGHHQRRRHAQLRHGGGQRGLGLLAAEPGMHVHRRNGLAGVGEHVQHAFTQGVRQRGMGNDEDARHGKGVGKRPVWPEGGWPPVQMC
jgi:hypothetical protein